MRSTALLAALSCFAAKASFADTLLSKNFYADSALAPNEHCQSLPDGCIAALDGRDHIPLVLNPWEPHPIDIVGAELVIVFDPAPASPAIVSVGNSFSPDIILWGVTDARGVVHERHDFPAGLTMPFPATADGKPFENEPGVNDLSKPHLDVHIAGRAPNPKVNYRIFLTVSYTRTR